METEIINVVTFAVLLLLFGLVLFYGLGLNRKSSQLQMDDYGTLLVARVEMSVRTVFGAGRPSVLGNSLGGIVEPYEGDSEPPIYVRTLLRPGSEGSPTPQPDMEHLPELALWFFVRVLVSVEGLQTASKQVESMSENGYFDRIHSELQRSFKGGILGVEYVDPLPHRQDLAVTAKLWPKADGRGIGPVCTVELEGPVGDLAYLQAPFHLLSQTYHLLTNEQSWRLQRYLEQLCQQRPHLYRKPLLAAQWVAERLKEQHITL